MNYELNQERVRKNVLVPKKREPRRWKLRITMVVLLVFPSAVCLLLPYWPSWPNRDTQSAVINTRHDVDSQSPVEKPVVDKKVSLKTPHHEDMKPNAAPEVTAAASEVKARSDCLSQARVLTQSIALHKAKFNEARQAMIESGGRDSPLLSQVLVATELENLAAIRPIIAELRELSSGILGKEKEFHGYFHALREDLAAAPVVFREAGDAYRAYAKEEQFNDIKQDYLMLADTWDKLADLVKGNQGGLDAEAKDVEDLLRYLANTDLFLERLDQHLVSFPNLYGIEKWKGHLADLQEYVRRFQSLRQTLRGIHDRLQRGTTSPINATGTESPANIAPLPEPKRFAIEVADNERVMFGLPVPNAVAAGEKLAIFRQSGALAGWATIDATEASRPIAFARSDVKFAAGDFVALPQRR